MIGDKLGRPLEKGQLVVVDAALVGADRMIEATVNSISELLLPGKTPMKTIELVAIYRINLPIEAAAIRGLYIALQAPTEDEIKSHKPGGLIEVAH